MENKILLKIENLTKTYVSGRGVSGAGFWKKINTRHVVAVNDVSLDIFAGESLALVGESGSGKSTLGRCILRLVRADRGRVLFNGTDVLQLSQKKLRMLRPGFQMIFQDSAQALNPRQSVGACLSEPLKVHQDDRETSRSNRVNSLLSLVGLDPELRYRFPHELSSGQRQRVAIARALTTNPSFLVADEPTSSLDAIHKRRIMALMVDLKRKLGLTLLLISHDIAMVSDVSDRTAVMYEGSIVELAPTKSLIRSPSHPYTRLLLDSASFGFDRTIDFSQADTNRKNK